MDAFLSLLLVSFDLYNSYPGIPFAELSQAEGSRVFISSQIFVYTLSERSGTFAVNDPD